MSKIILVTGGAGYVGSALIQTLLKKRYKIRVLDRLVFTESSLQDIKDKIELVKEDIRDVKENVMKNVFAVIHLAGFATEPTAQYSPRLTDFINHIATERLAKMAKKAGVRRFIFSSSCSVYFTYDTPLTPPLYKETDKINPISPYSLSKHAAEEALLEINDRNFPVIIFRKGTIYGLSPRMRYDLVVNSFVKDAFLIQHLSVNSGGMIFRPLVDIQDVVWAYVQALEMPLNKIRGKIFNVSSQNWNIGYLAKVVKKILEKEKNLQIKIDIQPLGLTRNYQADNTLFKKTFQFKPRRTLKKAILEIFSHLEKNKDKNFLNPIFYNDLWYTQKLKNGELNNL